MICILFAPRAGSKYYCRHLAQENNKLFLGEVFNSRTYPNNEQRIALQNSLRESPDVVFKVGPWQADHNTILDLCNRSEKIYVCWRRDINEQTKSLYAATRENVNNYHANIKEAHITYVKHDYEEARDWLLSQYQALSELIAEADNSKLCLVEYESFATQELRYKRNFIWDTEPQLISVDVEKILNPVGIIY